MRRFGQIIGLKSTRSRHYERLHAAGWPEVLAMISLPATFVTTVSFVMETHSSPILNMSARIMTPIWRRWPADPKTQAWWTFTEPLQAPLATAEPGEWWATMQEVFHTD